MTPFANVVLHFPKFPNWDENETLKNAGGAGRSLALNLAALKQASERASDAEASPERIAWLTCWTRLFSCADSAFRALDNEDSFSLELLTRVAFEVSLQFTTVVKPLIEHAQLDPSNALGWGLRHKLEQGLSELIRDRLHGYFAWTVHSDIQSYKYQLDPTYLRAIFDPTSARDLAEKESDEPWDGWYREIEVLSDQEAEFDRKRAEKHLHEQIDQLHGWYLAPELAAWRARIELVSSKKRQSGLPVTLFELYDERQTSITKALRELNLRWAYQAYADSSALIHGSTLHGYLRSSTGSALVPRILRVRGDPEDIAGGLADQLHWPTFALISIQELLGL